jgi:hypothetical protein
MIAGDLGARDMWQAAVGALIGYLFAMWCVQRGARKEIEAVRQTFAARLESRDEEITRLRDGIERSQRAVSAHERRARYLESAIITNVDAAFSKAPEGTPVTPAG